MYNSRKFVSKALKCKKKTKRGSKKKRKKKKRINFVVISERSWERTSFGFLVFFSPRLAFVWSSAPDSTCTFSRKVGYLKIPLPQYRTFLCAGVMTTFCAGNRVK